MQLKDKGVRVFVVTTDPSADTPEAQRAASKERYLFRTNPYSDIEEAQPKLTHAATNGWYKMQIISKDIFGEFVFSGAGLLLEGMLCFRMGWG